MLGLVRYDDVIEMIDALKEHINANYVKKEDYEALLKETVQLRTIAAKLDDMKLIDVDSIKESVINGLTGYDVQAIDVECKPEEAVDGQDEEITEEPAEDVEQSEEIVPEESTEVEEPIQTIPEEDASYYEDQPAYKVTVEPIEETDEKAVEREVASKMYDADNDIYVDL